MDWIALGERLRARRKQLGLTLREVGEKAGLSFGLLSGLERGDREDVKLVTIERFAQVMELEASVVLQSAETGAFIEQIVQSASQMDPHQIQQLARIAAALRHAPPPTVEGITLALEGMKPKP